MSTINDCLAVRLRAHLRYDKRRLRILSAQERSYSAYLWFQVARPRSYDYFWYPRGRPDAVRACLDDAANGDDIIPVFKPIAESQLHNINTR